LIPNYYEEMESPATRVANGAAETQTVAVIAEHIGIRPGFCGGEPHILGHRIKVRHIGVWSEQGQLTPAEIVATHPELTLGDVYAALAYFHDHIQEMRAAIADEDQLVDEMKSKAGPSPLREKLGQRNAKDDPISS
jgi:uncharacterized protein (DUF433 family)